MIDKRVKKTKKYLKETLIELLTTEPFEKITVTEICNRADISRITFYSHYEDKYDLVEDIFQEMIEFGVSRYYDLQNSNNKDHNMAVGFSIVMDCILDVYYENYSFFSHTNPGENPYLAFSFYNHVNKTVERYIEHEGTGQNLKYSTHQITGFLCYGLLGFIMGGHNDNIHIDAIKADAHSLLTSILGKSILFS